MEGRSERKWKTLRNISSSQEESEIAVFDAELDGIDATELTSLIETSGETEEGLETSAPEENVGEGVIESRAEELDDERVLVGLPVASTTRLIRETFENFTSAEVMTTSNPLRGFELALQRSYRVFLFGMQFEDFTGPTLYELISRAYANHHGPKRLPPGVIFIREENDPRLSEELSQDVRVNDVIS